jgi:hypothetical protein
MNALPQRQPDPRDEARAEARALLAGFRGALSSMSAVARAAVARRIETETVGNMDSLKD